MAGASCTVRRWGFGRVSGALLLVVAGVAAGDHPASAGDCFEGISEDNAKRLFDVLLRASAGGACALDEVHTEKSLIRIQWKKGGQILEDALVAPTSCVATPSVRGKVLSTVVPRSVADACTSEVDALNAAVVGDTFGGLVPVTGAIAVPELVGPAPRPWIRRHWARFAGLVGAGAGVVVGVVLLVRRRRARQRALPAAAPPAPPAC